MDKITNYTNLKRIKKKKATSVTLQDLMRVVKPYTEQSKPLHNVKQHPQTEALVRELVMHYTRQSAIFNLKLQNVINKYNLCESDYIKAE